MQRVANRTGGELLASQLRLNGTDLVFGVPGESYLPVLDALYAYQDVMPFIACRQEGGAAMMAEAHGKLTGRPGICIVTRGPGATNASAGIHVARQELDADDPIHRPGWARLSRPRGLPGGRFPGDVWPACKMGGTNR